jgi:hypothetical protein
VSTKVDGFIFTPPSDNPTQRAKHDAQFWDGETKRFGSGILVMIDDVDVDDADVPLADQQEIYVIQAMAGGCGGGDRLMMPECDIWTPSSDDDIFCTIPT